MEKKVMKQYGHFLLVVVFTISIAGCYTAQGRPDYTASGALAGGATGAIIGSAAGRHHGSGGLVGAAVGAVVGGLIGHSMDQEQEARLRAQAPQTLQRVEQGKPLTVDDVKSLAKAGISDDLIISQIRNSRTVYQLSTADIIDLKKAGISDKVIEFMINTQTYIPSTEVANVSGATPSPPPPLSETFVVAPGPDYVWVEGVWVWLGSRWVWHHGYWHRPRHHRHSRR
jgi:uncharacterized protein YcfJ